MGLDVTDPIDGAFGTLDDRRGEFDAYAREHLSKGFKKRLNELPESDRNKLMSDAWHEFSKAAARGKADRTLQAFTGFVGMFIKQRTPDGDIVRVSRRTWRRVLSWPELRERL